MEYIKVGNLKEWKVRIKQEIYEKIRKESFRQAKSMSLLLNEYLEAMLNKNSNIKNYESLLFSDKPNVVYNERSVKIYNNDFLTVDLSEYENKVNLVITSPPYNLSVDYGTFDDSIQYEDYLSWTKKWLEKTYRLLADDGRICVNIPIDKNKNGLKPVYADFIQVAKDVGFKYHSSIVWNEQNISKRTAWGSWMSASAPYVIAPVEMIVVMYKKQWKRINKGKSTITRDEFISWTNGVWNFPGESKKKIGHPAPFPVELPRRCIRLFSFEGDLILDPFMGSGTTLMASIEERRVAVGVEIDMKYIDIAINRINSVEKPLLLE